MSSPNFRKLWEEGIGRLALVYVLCLFGFIIWVGLAISWIFFHGIHPPLDKRGEINGSTEIADELSRMEYEPLLPIEKKLIGGSLLLGLLLLGLLLWVSGALFR